MKQTAPSLTIQTVIFENSFQALQKSLMAVTHSAQMSQKRGLISHWTVRWGDCSLEPILSKKEIRELTELVALSGGSFDYQFFGKNLGSAAGHNALAELSEDVYLLILNPDAETAPNCISSLVRTMKPKVGSVEARQLPLEHPKDYDYKSLETSWSSTACLLTTVKAYLEVKGFDSETFFLYCDDVDYSWRLRLAGWKVLYQPMAVVFHDKRLTKKAEWIASDAEKYFSAEAALLLAYKYSRTDVVKALLRYFNSGSEFERRASQNFKSRQRDGSLPDPIDPNHQVAQFTGGNYAKHRF